MLDELHQLNVSDKYTIYICLLNDLRKDESVLVEFCRNVHSLEYLKSLLNCKKETAIQNLAAILPLLKTRDLDAKTLIFKILPVLFSYVTLYDTEILNVLKICEILRYHPAFSADQGLFVQWFAVFERRMNYNIEKKFQYKDETYVQNLPKLKVDNYCPFSTCIGYADVGLLRTIHRWLRILRLHKYLFFFANLTYNDIISINHTNISYFEKTVGILEMTIGARNKILREIEELRNRRNRLKQIIQRNHFNPLDLEDAARELKRVMRSPISVDVEKELIGLTIDALKKVSYGVYKLIGTGEKIIPLYGLMISILKEAYNYSYFSSVQKENFNTWRTQLSAKINVAAKSNYDYYPIAIFDREDDGDDCEDDVSNESLSPIDSTELIAIQMANFVLH